MRDLSSNVSWRWSKKVKMVPGTIFEKEGTMRWIMAGLVGLALVGCGGKYLARYKGDPLTGNDRRQAEELLHIANIAFKFRDYPTATQYYQRVVNAWPKSRYATEAKARLGEIDKYEGVGLDTSRPWERPASFEQDVP